MCYSGSHNAEALGFGDGEQQLVAQGLVRVPDRQVQRAEACVRNREGAFRAAQHGLASEREVTGEGWECV